MSRHPAALRRDLDLYAMMRDRATKLLAEGATASTVVDEIRRAGHLDADVARRIVKRTQSSVVVPA